MITLSEYVDFCMSHANVTQDFPFDKKTMVFRYQNKMFALLNIESWQNDRASINLKNIPEINNQLREKYISIIPGYHMNKKHWNTINIWEEELDKNLIYKLTTASYEIIKNSFPRNKTKTHS